MRLSPRLELQHTAKAVAQQASYRRRRKTATTSEGLRAYLKPSCHTCKVRYLVRRPTCTLLAVFGCLAALLHQRVARSSHLLLQVLRATLGRVIHPHEAFMGLRRACGRQTRESQKPCRVVREPGRRGAARTSRISASFAFGSTLRIVRASPSAMPPNFRAAFVAVAPAAAAPPSAHKMAPHTGVSAPSGAKAA
jgi:hypothetical protein